VELSLALAALHNEIGAALEKEIGFRPETRPYFPHITLARIRDPVSRESIDQYLIDRRDFAVWEFPVAQMGLYSSRFRGNMPSYVAEAVFSVA
jgi:2'-5' RNA ligase